MGSAAHRIGRLRLRLRAADRPTLATAARNFEDGFEARLLPVIEAALDRIDVPGRVIRLERLELNLGRLDPRATDFAGALARALAVALRPSAGQSLSPVASEARQSQADPAEDLARYLATGVLPWPDPGAALATLVGALSAAGEARLRQVAHRLLPLLARAEVARRFLSQLPQSFLARLVFALAFWPPAAILAVPVGRYLSQPEVAALLPLVLALADAQGARETAATLAAALIAPAAAASGVSRTPAPSSDAGVLQPVLHGPAGDASPEQASARLAGMETAALPVAAAGGVLLHPYLARFFQTLGLTVAGRFPDLAAQERAVLLGHWLASGEADPAEPDCLLMKLLCGLPPGAPLPRLDVLTPVERDEGQALLAAMVRHWGLGATSAEGLREGFLRRPGLLRGWPEEPSLAVEKRGIDVLLDRLPWTIQVVKTPFMDRVLAVDWR